MKQRYYQLVRSYGKYDMQFTVHEARKDNKNNIEIISIPTILVGNYPEEIVEQMAHILEDMKKHPAIDKADCEIFDEEFDDE